MKQLFITDNIKSIRLSPNGFTLLEGQSILPPYQKMVIIDYMPPLLIPENLYDKNKNFDYVRLQYATNDSIEIMSEPLETYCLLYFMPIHDFYTIKNSIESPVFTHQSAFLYKIAEDELSKTDDFIQIFIDQTFIDITLKKKGQLRFINRFKWANDEDIAYYLFNIMKQFDLDSNSCKLLLYDEHGENSARLCKTLRQFYGCISTSKI